jgi:hypothetical protein
MHDEGATFYLANRDVILTELGDGMGVLLHLGTKFYYTLNATGVAAWKALELDGPQAPQVGHAAKAGKRGRGVTRTDIAEHIAREFRIDATTAARDVEPVLTEMLDEGLIARVG